MMLNKTILACLFSLLSSTLIAQDVNRIEPPNWWTGMKETSLQLMLYGKDLGQLTATTNYPGLRVKSSGNTGNVNYLIVNLDISPSTQPGTATFTLKDKQSKSITSFEYPLLAREPGSDQRIGFNTEDVIYLITPDRFCNGDPDNDSVVGMKEPVNRVDKNGRHGGDIEGMRQHLDYIRDMGFTALWPTPVIENNMTAYSYHGYACTDFYKVDARMGSNESYADFNAEARKKGLKPIMDMIVNHCGSEHWWMADPPTPDWFNDMSGPYTETNHVKSVQMDPYVAPEDRYIAEKGWFVMTMPDLNTDNPLMATYLIQNSIWWIEYAGLQGIRMDTYLYPDETFMAAWSKAIMTEYPKFNIVGEVWHDTPALVSYWQKGSLNNTNVESWLPSVFDFPVHFDMVKALTTADHHESGWRYLYETLAQDFLYPDPGNLVVMSDNHDMPRLFALLRQDTSLMKNALAFIMTTRGIPQVYYGTEILMTSPLMRDDGLIRADMPGGWKEDTVNAFKGEGLLSEQLHFQGFIKRLLNWRKSADVIHYGQLTHYVPEAGVYVYFRYTEDQRIMVILNKNTQPLALSLGRFSRMIGNHTSARDVLSGKTISLNDKLQLESAGPLILELQ